MIGSQIFDKIIIDNQEQNIDEIDSNHGKVQLESGKHDIQYVFKDNITEIPTELFQNCKSLTHLEIPKHFTIADYALDGTMLDNINEYILNYPASCYHDKYYLYLGPIKPTLENIVELLSNEQYTKVIPLSDLNGNKMLLPKRDNTGDATMNKKYFNIDQTDNGQLYFLFWEGWIADMFEQETWGWPAVYFNDTFIKPEYNGLDHSLEKHYSLNFGYDKYKCFILDTNNIGQYEVRLLNENGVIGIVTQLGYEMYDSDGNLITTAWLQDDPNHNLCTVGMGTSKYYKGNGYTEIDMDNKSYYIKGSWNDDFTTIFVLYDDHLIKTNNKIKIFDYVLH